MTLEARSLVGEEWTPWTPTTEDSAALIAGMFYRPLSIGEVLSVPFYQLRRTA